MSSMSTKKAVSMEKSEQTLPAYLEQVHAMLGQLITEFQAVFAAMETEHTQVNTVIGKLKDQMYSIPVMPNNANIIQEATRQMSDMQREIGNLKFALLRHHKMNHEYLNRIMESKDAITISK